jgi:protoporphyrinogen oxidase
MSGIASAYYLAKAGHCDVTLFEKEGALGGASSYFQWRDLIWDRFYHVVLSTDLELIRFLAELKLENELFWQETKSGFWGEGKLVSLASPLDFIRFPFLSYWEKLRLAFGILYCSRIKNPAKLHRIYVRQWLTRVFGRRVYERIWDPLLRCKLGNARERTSAALMWATIRRLYGARKSRGKREVMGHVQGGYRRILEVAESKLIERGVAVRTGAPVLRLAYAEKRRDGHQPGKLEVTTAEGTACFDKALLTVACPEVLRLLDCDTDDGYWRALGEVDYLGVVCVLLILTRSLSPYYVINLLDRELPFTGIIEATNVVASERLGGRYLVYLPKYISSDDPLHDTSDEAIVSLFIQRLRTVFPDLHSSEVLHAQVFRERYTQPLQVPGGAVGTLGFRTSMRDVYVANTSMLQNSTVNNNAVVGLVRQAVEEIVGER